MSAMHAPAWLQRLWRRRWVRFLVVGGMNTAVSYGIYALLVFFGMNFALANLCSLAIGILFSYRTHAALVFGGGGWPAFLRYVATWGAIYVVNVGLIAGFIRIGLDPYSAGALAILPSAALSYVLQKCFVFGKNAPA